MRHHKSWFAALAGIAALALIWGSAAAQPKPITSCGAISLTGSYILNANVNSTSTTASCINVTASGVTIDLNGFVISGKGGTSIAIISSASALSVRNGTISGFGYAIFDTASGARISDLTVMNSTKNYGIFLGGSARVSDSLFLNNAESGLGVGANALVTHCVFGGNGVDGFGAGGIGAVVEENSAGSNKSGGFITSGKATLVGNAATNNPVQDFYDSAGGATYDSNTASGSINGFQCNSPVTGKIQGNSVFLGNTAHANTHDGFVDAGGTTFRANTADSNGIDGFASQGETTFSGNTSDANKVGFSVYCPVNLVGNTAENNSTAAFSSPVSGCDLHNNLGF
jgi:hypothetical protein